VVATNKRRVACGFSELIERGYAMSRNLSQPEEIDLVLNGMSTRDMEADLKMEDIKTLSKSAQYCWNTGSISPYRAAYMKAHGLVP
jgi:hypothetical protein